MSAAPNPPPPPTVIGSGKPHTVALKPGSKVATRETARPRDEDPTSGLAARLMAKLRRGEEAAGAKRSTTASETLPPASEPQNTAQASAAAPATGLSDAIRQRLDQLRQRNEAVRSDLDGLPPAGRRAR
jgi:hypothetical protein